MLVWRIRNWGLIRIPVAGLVPVIGSGRDGGQCHRIGRVCAGVAEPLGRDCEQGDVRESSFIANARQSVPKAIPERVWRIRKL